MKGRTRPLQSRFRSLLLLAALLPGASLARAQELPLTDLPLNDLGPFRSPGDNWRIVGDVTADPNGGGAFQTSPGTGVLINTGTATYDERQNLFTTMEHGDLELELDFMVPQGSNSGVYLQGRYEIQIMDSWGKEHPTFSDAGGIYQRWDSSRSEGNEGFQGYAPRVNVSRAPGLWQHFRIIFRAPRFDAQGRKTANARFERVEHNGVVVHENVELTGPTRAAAFRNEQPMGPLMIQGDHGPVAFRNIRYKHLGDARVRLSDLRYELREGEFTSLDDLAAVMPTRSDSIDGLRWDVVGGARNFAVTYTGTMEVPETGDYLLSLGLDWIDGDPHLQGATVGGGELTVGGRTVLTHTGRAYQDFNRTRLEAGRHPFTLTYFKKLNWGQPVAVLAVEGPRVDRRFLNAPGTIPEDAPVSPIAVRPTGEPYVLRGFVPYGDQKLTDAVSVGDPSGLHYALDLESGALLRVWRGGFVDASAMWQGRGYEQTADPTGSVVDLSGAPSVARLADRNAAWPDSLSEASGYRFIGYTLDAEGRPTFRYTLHGVEVSDRIAPAHEGRALGRQIVVERDAGGGSFYVRAAEGDRILKVRDGLYRVDGRYYIGTQTGADAQPVIRTQGGRQELLLPVEAADDGREVGYLIVW